MNSSFASHTASDQTGSGGMTGADRGGGGVFIGFERTPLFTDSVNLLVLCYSQQCLTLGAGMPV